jgi:vanillate O-demethylase ferredoxin subunit
VTLPGYFGDATVRSVSAVARDVRLVEIEPAAGVSAFALGSHLDLSLLIDGMPDTRSYSLVGAGPIDGSYRIAVKLLPNSRGGSRWVHDLVPGQPVRISKPTSHFQLLHGRTEYLLIAGGIGITALVGMAETLARGDRPFRLLYAGANRDRMPFLDELTDVCGSSLEVCVSGEGHRLDVRAAIDGLHPDGEAYVCGPLRLMDAARTAWIATGRPPARLRIETFGASGRYPSASFTVRVADAGRQVEVPATRTLLAALTEAGIDVMWDCLRGECGLCTVAVLDTDHPLDHRDVFLSEDERAAGTALCACVSRASSGTVTIDTGARPDPARWQPAPGSAPVPR